ncbi:MAG: hypothetical protein ACLFUH_10560 [Bacteroidales bacterium]
MPKGYGYKPPKYAQKNAKKALECLKEGSDAMTKVGKKRAKQIAKGEMLSQEDLKDISSFRRHKKNARYSGDICEDKGAVSWLGWGYGFDKRKPETKFGEWAESKWK